jgi:hypothetical protein
MRTDRISLTSSPAMVSRSKACVRPGPKPANERVFPTSGFTTCVVPPSVTCAALEYRKSSA